jgi:hypothetical protein
MRRSCSDSLLTASQSDGVFGSDTLAYTVIENRVTRKLYIGSVIMRRRDPTSLLQTSQRQTRKTSPMTNSNDIGPDSPILHYLRNIEAKLDRLNERLDKFLSARKKKGGARTGDADNPARVEVFGTREAAEEYLKMHPSAADDDDLLIIITGVPRAGRDPQ